MTTRPVRRTPLRLALCALLGVSVTAVACNTDMPTAAQIESADVAAVTKSLGVPLASERTVYLVDGVKTTGEEARALPPEEIASIDVRGTKDPAVTEVRILTGKYVPEQEVLIETLPNAAGTLKIKPRRAVGDESTVLELKKTPATKLRLGGSADANAQPLVVLDGVIMRQGADALRDVKLNPDGIASIEVIKGPAAATSYGDAGKNGVIVITSKKP